MRIIGPVYLIVLLGPLSAMSEDADSFVPSKGVFTGAEEWLIKCQSDDECTTISTHDCGFIFGVNKNYSLLARMFANWKLDTCPSMPEHPFNNNVIPTCRDNECGWVAVP